MKGLRGARAARLTKCALELRAPAPRAPGSPPRRGPAGPGDSALRPACDRPSPATPSPPPASCSWRPGGGLSLGPGRKEKRGKEVPTSRPGSGLQCGRVGRVGVRGGGVGLPEALVASRY